MNELSVVDATPEVVCRKILGELENGVSEPLYPGDERRLFADALVPLFVGLFSAVNDAARQKTLRYARGNVLDALGERLGVRRLDPVPARTRLKFTLNAPVERNVLIPQGTRATSDFVRTFATTEAAVIPAGSLSVVVDALGEGGAAYNDVPAGAVATLVDLVPFVDSVENTEISYGGGDEEDDDALRSRIRLAPTTTSTAGSVEAYRFWAKSADPNIGDVAVIAPPLKPVHIEDPNVVTIVPTVEIVPVMKGGELPDEDVLARVLEVVSADDVRPLTDQVTVRAPEVVPYDIEIEYFSTLADKSRVMEAVEGRGGALDRYRFWQDSTLGRNVNPDKLRALVLAPDWSDGLTGPARVDVTCPARANVPAASIAKHSGRPVRATWREVQA